MANSLLDMLTFIKAPSRKPSPEQHRRNRMIAHLEEQLAIAQADATNATFVTNTDTRIDLSSDATVANGKRERRWWLRDAQGNLGLKVRWNSKLIEFEKGKKAIAIKDLQGVIATLKTLIDATRKGELDAYMLTINQQRARARASKRGKLF
jgi:hypothetical protein